MVMSLKKEMKQMFFVDLPLFPLAFFLEGQRMDFRKSGGQIPFLPESLDQLVQQHSGDFGNGFLQAMVLNYAIKHGLNVLSYDKGKENERYVQLSENSTAINVAAGLASMAIVTLAETTRYLGTPDIKDIPMGYLGALLYMGLRQYTMGRFKG